MKQHDIDRFWSKVDTSGDCWIWNGTVSNGHAVIYIEKAARLAVRVAWEIVRETPPQPRIDLRRTCDNPLCIKPDHRSPFIKQVAKKTSPPRYKTFADTPAIIATYYILNLVNHRIYVGETGNLQVRFRAHLSSLRSNNHQSSALQSDWNIYGQDAFEFGILVEGVCPASWIERKESFEDMFVRIYQSDNPAFGYNIGHFEGRAGLAFTHIEKLNQLADAWSIGGRRRDNETIRRCIDYTYQQLFSDEANT